MLESLQNEVDRWIKTYGVRYFDELTNTAILMEEVGELAKLIARIYGQQSFKNEVSTQDQREMFADELADVLFVLTCLANQTGVDLSEAMRKNLLKKTQRDPDRHRSNRKLSD